MGLSSTLLLVAVVSAVAPMLSIGFRPPSTLRHLEKAFVVGTVTLVVTGFVASRLHHLEFFALAHLAYLLAVVTVPMLLGGWYILSRIRRQRSLLLTVAGAIATCLALVGIWATHIEPNWLRVDRATTIAIVTEPITIGVLADVQTPNVGRHEWNAVDTLIAEQPDLVVVPGDFFQGPPETIEANRDDFIALLQKLVDEVGVVAVVSGDGDRPGVLAEMSDAAGAIFLDNIQRDITVRGQSIRLAGIAVETNPVRLDAIAALTTPSDAFTVLVSHRPGVVYDLPLGSDVDLIVAGHTHGGQVAFPFFGPPVTAAEVPRDIAAGGIGTIDNYAIYVSTGVGLQRYAAPQVRFGVRPSVGIITITPGG